MTKLDWQKARERRSNGRAKRHKTDTALRQQALTTFVAKHSLACFKCGTQTAEWAKTGISKHSPWAICTPCVKSG